METINISNNWRYKINIKHLFEDRTTPQLIVTLCNSLIPQLKVVNKNVEKATLIDEDEKYYFTDKLEEIVDDLEFLQQLADGSIKKAEWDNYGFEGDLEDKFNYSFNCIYDLGDTRILLKSNISEKFLWVE